MEDFLNILGEFGRAHKPLPGPTIMVRVIGSRSYNLHGPTSDWDWYGVFVSPLGKLLSLGHKAEDDKVHGDGFHNYQFHELLPFAKMIAAGNPNMIEALCCQRMIHVTPAWEQLRLIRHRFVTRQVVKNYIEYGRGQIERYHKGESVHSKGGKPGEKWLYHILRLGQDALKLARGQEPVLWREGGERDLILRVRRQEIPDDKVIALAEGMFKAVEGMAPYPLPEEPDIEALNRWMCEVRGIPSCKA